MTFGGRSFAHQVLAFLEPLSLQVTHDQLLRQK
jgi:hypothetical protein